MAPKKSNEDPEDKGYRLGEELITQLEQEHGWSIEEFYEALASAKDALADRLACQASGLRKS